MLACSGRDAAKRGGVPLGRLREGVERIRHGALATVEHCLPAECVRVIGDGIGAAGDDGADAGIGNLAGERVNGAPQGSDALPLSNCQILWM